MSRDVVKYLISSIEIKFHVKIKFTKTLSRAKLYRHYNYVTLDHIVLSINLTLLIFII